MSERDLSVNVALARERLAALRERLAPSDPLSPASESSATLDELREVLDQLASRHGLLRVVLDRTSDIIFAKDRAGRYQMINGRGATMLGKSIDEVLGTDDTVHHEAALAERIMNVDREVMSSCRQITREETFEQDQRSVQVVTSTTTWYGEDGSIRGVIGVAQDVTARNERDGAALRDLGRVRSMAAGLVLREEALRHSLAAQIQSGICQELALAKLKLSMLRTSAGTALRDALKGIEQLIDQADQSLRAITLQISPPALHEFGLVPALQWLSEEIEREYGLAVQVIDESSPAIEDERVRVILFRAVRELLVNVATHGAVQSASVHVGGTADGMTVVVEDLGVGFDIEELQHRGLGLFGLRQQMQYLGGNIEVTSATGVGTRVTLTAPVGAPV
jgi:PAS domain S-box-containing protein